MAGIYLELRALRVLTSLAECFWRMRCETLTHSGAYIDLKPYAASRRPHGGMWGTLLVKSVARAYLVARAKGGLIRTLRF